MTIQTHVLRDAAALRDRPAAYGLVSRLDHWIVAGSFLAALGLGLVIGSGGLEREQGGALMDWHKLLGVAVLLLGLWRVGWRLAEGFPASATAMQGWQERASKAVHLGLLAAILAMPLSGVLMTLAGGRVLDAWGVTLLPALPETPWLDAAAGAVHEALPWAVLALLALHVGGALKHHLVDRDDTLARMTTGRATRA